MLPLYSLLIRRVSLGAYENGVDKIALFSFELVQLVL